jgi:predicted transcriptional regulator
VSGLACCCRTDHCAASTASRASAITGAELEGIDRGQRDAAEGRFASDAKIEAAFARFRRR